MRPWKTRGAFNMAKKDTTEKLMDFTAALLLLPLVMILSAWVFWLYWGWFAVPIFSVGALTLWEALGVRMLIGIALLGVKAKRNDDTPACVEFAASIISALFFALFGLIIHSLMPY